MEPCEGYELKLVSHAGQFGLETRDGFIVELLSPVKTRRTIVSQHFPGILRVDCVSELLGLLQIWFGGFAPQQIGVRRIGQTACDGGTDAAANSEESLWSALSGAELTIAGIDVTGEKVRTISIGSSHHQRGNAHDVGSEPRRD